MTAISTSSLREDTVTSKPWYRRTWVILAAAVIMVASGWVSGVLQLPISFKSSASSTSSATMDASRTVPQVAASAYVIPPKPVGNDSSISPVPLPLILTGTMPGRNSHEGTAFIGVNKDSPQTYAAGALLANNARIAEIYTDHVVLEKEGKQASLYLLGTGKTTDNKQLAGLLTVGGPSSVPPAKITSHEILTDYIRPSPVYDGQVLKGYQVYPGQHAGVFAQMGLEPGDMITAINGMALIEPHSAIEQLKQLTNGYAVSAVVQRKDNENETLSLDGALIAKDQEQLLNPSNHSAMNSPPPM
jgi:general secretion pathway protein C